MNFIALDIETANADLSSICQIGLVKFENGKIISKQDFLINPETYFDPMNTSIHGITEETVKKSPNFKEISNKIFELISNSIVITHTSFDISSLRKAAQQNSLILPSFQWIDNAKVARRTWQDVAYTGYALKKLATRFEIEFTHHNAVEDARATGLIFLKALQETNLSLSDWLIRVNQSLTPETKKRLNLLGNEEGALSGEKLVFTGALTLPRREAAALAANMGCDVSDNVNKDTTILVVGDQDVKSLAGHEKSSKHRKAEDLILKGYNIRIIGESDFIQLVNYIK